MAKKYYWLKLQEDFFQCREMKRLRNIAGGPTYMIIYLKLLLLAMKTDGIIRWTGFEESIAEELSLDIDEGPADIDTTLKYLQKVGLIEVYGNELAFLYAIEKTGKEGDSAERMRRWRERHSSQSDALPSHCDTEKRREELRKDVENREELRGDQEVKDKGSPGRGQGTAFSGYEELGAICDALDPERNAEYARRAAEELRKTTSALPKGGDPYGPISF